LVANSLGADKGRKVKLLECEKNQKKNKDKWGRSEKSSWREEKSKTRKRKSLLSGSVGGGTSLEKRGEWLRNLKRGWGESKSWSIYLLRGGGFAQRNERVGGEKSYNLKQIGRGFDVDSGRQGKKTSTRRRNERTCMITALTAEVDWVFQRKKPSNESRRPYRRQPKPKNLKYGKNLYDDIRELSGKEKERYLSSQKNETQ